MNLARLFRMSPDELRTRARQALSKRWARPPACKLIASSASPSFPAPPPLDSPDAAATLQQRRFDLLGYQDLDFGSPIDWHYDPVHQKRAPRQPWHKIPFLDFDQVGDHKIIWELNRHQHLVTLAQAGFRDEVLAQWTHWQAENPYPIGINWASSLEVAFRALSWLWVRSLLGDFHPDLISALHLHGWYIERFPSTYFSPNTHLLGEAVALFSIGVMCPQIAEAAGWQARGWQIILQQAQTQVRPGGFHFEQSVYYHVYARDFFEFARNLAARNAIAIPPAFDGAIEKMNDALAALSRAGRFPNFGDDDGGRVIAPLPRPLAPTTAQTVGGIYIMSSGDSHLFINAGPPGALTAGHTHADALSIQLITGGRPVLIDPGTFCYVCPERDRFRGTAAHNTLQLDGADQAQPAGPFAWTNLSETVVDLWYTSPAFDLFAGRHKSHQRWVFCLKSGLNATLWLVRDLVTEPRPSTGSHRLAIHWHYLDLHDLVILAPQDHTWTESDERWDWSPVYGRKEPAWVLRFTRETALPAEFAVMLVPRNHGVFTQTAPGSYEYKEPQGSHQFIFTGDRFTYRVTTAVGVTEHHL
ncbi:MAG TPA: alginate lyase family protein [Bryobacteraceae bacterium]|nr:alginate lyase family protein [Bryobacteraceae bacterium]